MSIESGGEQHVVVIEQSPGEKPTADTCEWMSLPEMDVAGSVLTRVDPRTLCALLKTALSLGGKPEEAAQD
jgi:hypothetical protein